MMKIIFVNDLHHPPSEFLQNKVIIAAKGIVTGGRVLCCFEHYIGLEKTTVIMVGYQAEGTRGRRLLEGADEIKIYGNYYNVEAKIVHIEDSLLMETNKIL